MNEHETICEQRRPGESMDFSFRGWYVQKGETLGLHCLHFYFGVSLSLDGIELNKFSLAEQWLERSKRHLNI